MQLVARLSSNQETLPFRTRYREEMNCQITKDSIHSRDGWTRTYLVERNGIAVGFGSIAIAGPWKKKPTVIEFYVLPEHRQRAFDLFEVFVASSGARFFEVRSNDSLLAVLAHTYGKNIVSESIVFQDRITSTHIISGATLRLITPEKQIMESIERRQGGGEWVLDLQGETAGKGGILFHYNRPYGDIYMEIEEPFRRRGLGTYLVQELKRECRRFGAVPCARCNPSNIPSRRTLLSAGFVPCAHILNGSIDRGRVAGGSSTKG
jgi:GNAT superfamily N-acetyltransferase